MLPDKNLEKEMIEISRENKELKENLWSSDMISVDINPENKISWISEENTKWLNQLCVIIPQWHPSAWLSAKHWPARARLSHLSWRLVRHSHFPWTPRKKSLPISLSKRPGRSALQPWRGMHWGEKSVWPLKMNLLQKNNLWKLFCQNNALTFLFKKILENQHKNMMEYRGGKL